MMRTGSAIFGIAAASALAGFSSGAFAAPCTTALLTTYLPNGTNAGCTVLDKTFTFPFEAYTATQGFPTVMNILVTPVLVPNNPGLQLSANFGVPPGLGPPTVPFPDISLIFDVTAPASNPITGASTTLTPISPAATVIDDEFVNGTKIFTITSPNTTASFNFSPSLTNLHVVEDIAFTNGGMISTITKQFAEGGVSPPPPPVPEPASLALLGAGLVGFGLLRRRKS